MSLKIEVDAVDVQWQIEMLKHYPEIANKHFYPAMHRALRTVTANVNIPQLTGAAADTYKTRASGKGLWIKGQAGWWGKGMPWYINIVEHGAREHLIPDDNEKKFLSIGEGVTGPVEHPGLAPRYFMRTGFERSIPAITEEFERAKAAVLEDLVVR